MRRSHANRRDVLQNIAITLLSVSAVLLFIQTQSYMLLPDDGFVGSFFQSGTAGTESPSQETVAALSAPVQIVVSGTYGRYGDIALSTADADRFGRLLAPLLSEALGSKQSFSPCTQTDFLSALSRASVYYDFLQPLPLSVLSMLVGLQGSSDDSGVLARYVVISELDSTVSLLIWDGADSFLRCETGVKSSRLQDVISSYELGNAAFAFDLVQSDPVFEDISPCSLFVSPMPQFQTLNVSAREDDTSSLLSALGFNPYANTRYTESNGTEVVMEGDQTLRISADGQLRYQSGARSSLFIADSDSPTLDEAVQGAWELLQTVISGHLGSAVPYLSQVTQSGDTTVLRFGFHVDGTPVRFLDDAPAAEIRLQGSAVTSLSVTLRSYALSGDSASPLPLRQAAAIAALEPGKDLSLAYVDDGGSTCELTWLSE